MYLELLKNSPYFIEPNLCYLTVMGSRAYNTHNKDSDYDYYGFCIPPSVYLDPFNHGYIIGFDKIPTFDQWQQKVPELNSEITIYSLPRYLKLLADGNPNIVESIFTNKSLHIFKNKIAETLLDCYELFLTKEYVLKTLMYAKSQIERLNRKFEGKRIEFVEKYGYDVKSASHCIRLLCNANQAMRFGNIDLTLNADLCKKIRNGELTKGKVLDIFEDEKEILEIHLQACGLPEKSNREKVKDLLESLLNYAYEEMV